VRSHAIAVAKPGVSTLGPTTRALGCARKRAPVRAGADPRHRCVALVLVSSAASRGAKALVPDACPGRRAPTAQSSPSRPRVSPDGDREGARLGRRPQGAAPRCPRTWKAIANAAVVGRPASRLLFGLRMHGCGKDGQSVAVNLPQTCSKLVRRPLESPGCNFGIAPNWLVCIRS
jgi:hypothetical protein